MDNRLTEVVTTALTPQFHPHSLTFRLSNPWIDVSLTMNTRVGAASTHNHLQRYLQPTKLGLFTTTCENDVETSSLRNQTGSCYHSVWEWCCLRAKPESHNLCCLLYCALLSCAFHPVFCILSCNLYFVLYFVPQCVLSLPVLVLYDLPQPHQQTV